MSANEPAAPPVDNKQARGPGYFTLVQQPVGVQFALGVAVDRPDLQPSVQLPLSVQQGQVGHRVRVPCVGKPVACFCNVDTKYD